MKIAVCFKILPDPNRILPGDWDNFTPGADFGYAGWNWNCFDEAALEIGLKIKQQAAVQEKTVTCTAVTVSEHLPEQFAQRLYAAGYDEVMNLKCSDREFVPDTVAGILADAVASFDLILMGRMAGMAETGMVPYLTARHLAYSIAANAEHVFWEDGLWGDFHTPRGLARHKLHMPLVLTVGNSPEVLRAVTLRRLMQFRSSSARDLEPEIPVTASETLRFSKPELCRSCTMLDPDSEDTYHLVHRLLQKGSEVLRNPGDPVKIPDCPGLCIFADTPDGRVQAVRMSEEQNIPCFFGGTAVNWNAHSLTLEKTCWEGHLLWQKELPLPAVWTCPGRTDPPTGHKREEILLEEARTDSLTDASAVIACGAGMMTKAACEQARKLAVDLGAGFGLTRSAALNAWGSTSEILGQSGLQISPACLLVLGASGAGAFLTGIQRSKCIIAVNHDPNALIFKSADYGICADTENFLKRFAQ